RRRPRRSAGVPRDQVRGHERGNSAGYAVTGPQTRNTSTIGALGLADDPTTRYPRALCRRVEPCLQGGGNAGSGRKHLRARMTVRRFLIVGGVVAAMVAVPAI